MKSRSFRSWAILAGILWIAAGCSGGGSGDKMIAAANDTNIKRLATLYSFFHVANKFKGPKTETEFRQFIEQQDASRLALANIKAGELDKLFVSERDGEPFKIRYGIDTRVRGPALAVIFEATGVDGKRHVGFAGAQMREVDSTEYDRLWRGEGDQGGDGDGRPATGR